MSGRIIPAPFAIPVMVTSVPPIRIERDNAFGPVSVVMIARAAGSHASPMALAALGMPSRSFANGNR